jgi:hypothetical protein
LAREKYSLKKREDRGNLIADDFIDNKRSTDPDYQTLYEQKPINNLASIFNGWKQSTEDERNKRHILSPNLSGKRSKETKAKAKAKKKISKINDPYDFDNIPDERRSRNSKISKQISIKFDNLEDIERNWRTSEDEEKEKIPQLQEESHSMNRDIIGETDYFSTEDNIDVPEIDPILSGHDENETAIEEPGEYIEEEPEEVIEEVPEIIEEPIKVKKAMTYKEFEAWVYNEETTLDMLKDKATKLNIDYGKKREKGLRELLINDRKAKIKARKEAKK